MSTWNKLHEPPDNMATWDNFSSVPRFRRIKEIDLGGDWIGDAGVEKVVAVLRKNKEVTSICLDDNAITSTGARKLAKALSKCTQLI